MKLNLRDWQRRLNPHASPLRKSESLRKRRLQGLLQRWLELLPKKNQHALPPRMLVLLQNRKPPE